VIVLDYRVSKLWYEVAAPKLALTALDKFQLETEVLLGEAVIIIDGHDHSWHVDLPLLDFARSLFIALVELSPLEPEARVRTADYEEWIDLLLGVNGEVLVSPIYTADAATCDLWRLIEKTACFGVRMYDDFVSAHPEVKKSVALDDWYPLCSMKRLAQNVRTGNRHG
jgi:hypothetical protein